MLDYQQMKEKLLEKAVAASETAYCPYSDFKVGAAIVSQNGKIYTGCNIENSSYGLTNCAERTAVFTAVADGARAFSALAVAGGKDVPAVPCGACLQVLSEFCKPDMPVYLTTLSGSVSREMKFGDLMPSVFQLKK